MQLFDWQYKDRMSRIAAAYARAGMRVSLAEHFINLNFGTVTPGTISPPQSITFNREADFFWLGTSAGDLLIEPKNYTPSWFDSDVSVKWEVGQNNTLLGRHRTVAPAADTGWIPLPSVSGYGRRPYLWPFPVGFHAGDSLTGRIHNAGALAVDVAPRLQLHGVKVYRTQPRGFERIALPELAAAVALPPAETENPWRSVNGYDALRRRLGKMPDLEPFQLVFTFAFNTPAAVGQELEMTATRRVEGEADFYVVGSYATAQDPTVDFESFDFQPTPEGWTAKVMIQEETGGIRFMSDFVSLGHIFGGECANDLSTGTFEDGGVRVYLWPVPAIWRAGREIRITIRHRFNASVPNFAYVAKLVFVGFKKFGTTPDLPLDYLLEPRLLETFRDFRSRGQLGRVEPFFYAFNFDSLSRQVGLETQSRTLLITDAAFAGLHALGTVYAPDSGLLARPSQSGMEALLQFTINEGARRLQDRPQQFYNVTGIGKRPHNLSKPLIVMPGESLTTIYTPLTRVVAGQGNWDTYVTLAGARIFPGDARW